jgi:hypothetical protein
MLAQFMDLGMTIVASRDAVIRPRGLDLFIFELPVGKALLFEPGLQESAAAPAAVIVGTVRLHVDEVLFAHHRLDHEAQVLGDRVPIALSYDLAGVLHRELDLEVFVPVGVDFKFALPDPLGVVFINVLDYEIVLEVELFQSLQDRKGDVPSLGVEKDPAA